MAREYCQDEPEYDFYLGQVWAGLGKADKAIEALQRAVKGGRKDAAALSL